ncbi:Rieske (2Fe-2S) protein [Xanthomonas arboricola pv. juglandis]|uniref:Rieske (2Fe-2S) protein n=1 Tax=Xanthomonas arboricola TaxID=56448 RepID=UPI0002E05D70|nr:Rieske (2Fe-2S) protein [Xanthomonas arboricola]RYF00642.1 MAG: Rieske (2Fe-2S) protein [Oxalobacteraceae bacterium]MDN0219089.1 Rieske (2Fe-2S) protein [Xanthomonas arboricola pv. juglandis]MDN0223613.1 Rieske (2Fe-2S) protein [Xanthomonas arboricola pv. juglandis]MDN0228067.1 Rieske (2Fe-2S) protein [Xanthomonas arboricola pv. juglandis]MDN0232054.1 Rieske (2Fe-2S) protein [Xanthomonas arboricola pv. juglandis]
MSSSSSTTLAELAQIPDAGFLEVEAVWDGGPESLVLYRDGAQVRAWLNVCPHAGRRLDWAPGQFLKTKEGHLVCAAHGAAFELGGGECISGPCRGQSLLAVPVRVEGDQVVLG